MKLKKVFGIGIAIALMTPIGVLAAQPAGAATVLTCAKPSGKVTFTPGLGSTPKIQTTSFSLPVTGCKGTPGVTSGTSKGSSKGTTKDTCASLGSGATKTAVTITWINKKTSTSNLSTTVVKGAPGVLTATVVGKISKGLFVGKTLRTKVKITLQKGVVCTDAHPLKTATLTGLAPLTIG
jgi:hypothetical protein